MLTAALFVISPNWRQTSPSAGKEINCGIPIPWNTNSAIKRNKLSIHTITWMKLKVIMLSKRSQPEKRVHTVRFHLYKVLGNIN